MGSLNVGILWVHQLIAVFTCNPTTNTSTNVSITGRGNNRHSRHVSMGINPLFNLEDRKLIGVHVCTQITFVHVCTKTLHRQLFALHTNTLLTPVNLWCHISKESHAQNCWHTLLQHKKRATVSKVSKSNLQLHLSPDFNQFLVSQTH